MQWEPKRILNERVFLFANPFQNPRLLHLTMRIVLRTFFASCQRAMEMKEVWGGQLARGNKMVAMTATLLTIVAGDICIVSH